MRYLLSLLLVFGAVFAQKTTIIKTQVDDEKKIEVKVNVEGEKIHYSITEDGKTEEFELDIDDQEAMEKMHQKLEIHDLDQDVKIKVCKKIKNHDCKIENCDPATCKRLKMLKANDKKIIKKIKKHKLMDEPFGYDENAGFLGVYIEDMDEELSKKFKVKNSKGAVVTKVLDDSPAAKAGLEEGDIVTKVGDKEISDATDLTEAVRSYKPDSKVSINVLRDGKKKKLKAKLGKAESKFKYKFEDFDFEEFDLDDEHKMLFKMHGDKDDFDFKTLHFDRDKLSQELDQLRQEMDALRKELKELKKNK